MVLGGFILLYEISLFNVAGVIIFIALIFVLPLFMRMRIFSSIERSIGELEKMVAESREMIMNLSENKDPDIVDGFLEFFIIPPTDLDPTGVAEKFRKILEMGETRFRWMAKRMAPDADPEKKAQLIMCIKIVAGLKGILKLLRHNLELARKTGNLQILLGLQMNLPLVMRIAKAEFDGVRSVSKCLPVGDGAGPLTVGMFIGCDDKVEYMHDMVVVKKRFYERDITLLRPQGPGARLGRVVKALEDLNAGSAFDKVIMVDAAVKLEGEITGTVAEGVGVAMGGTGVEKWFLENMVLDCEPRSVIIKMSPEEALSQMTDEILEGCSKASKIIERIIRESDKNSNLLIIGVGNSSGIPDAVEDPSSIKVKKTKKDSED